jgi:Ca2+-binding EF-hand superfamily protein
MKNKIKYGILALTAISGIALVTQLAVAADKKEEGKKREGGIEKLDTNKDGAVTLEEMKAAPTRNKEKRSADAEKRLEERFKKLDTNKDGKVDAAEVAKFEEERNKPVTKKDFMKKSEERAEKAFEKLDTNKDNVIDVNERKAAREELRKKLEERRQQQKKN